jgi:AraC family transcriptional regulator, transcriptional activator of pobA
METLKFITVSDLMHRLHLPPPMHPLIALVDLDQHQMDLSDAGRWFVLDLYKITFKKQFSGSVRYGPGTYDLKEGGMAFLAPGQTVQMSGDPKDHHGYVLYFHPQLLTGHPLSQRIHQYGFFDYSVAEALYLSVQEKQIMEALFQAMAFELESATDRFSQDVLVSQLDLLLNHSNRFYDRQFHTRKNVHHELITRMNAWLNDRFGNEGALIDGLPSTQDVADQLQVSQRYLSDMLRSVTGKTTQQHIHLALIEKAKELLNRTDMTVAEIAYQLGFEHPQSFNKIFKQRTNVTPVQYRNDQVAKN